jgi:hypothetical protein
MLVTAILSSVWDDEGVEGTYDLESSVVDELGGESGRRDRIERSRFRKLGLVEALVEALSEPLNGCTLE